MPTRSIAQANTTDLTTLRHLYAEAAFSEDVAQRLHQRLRPYQGTDAVVLAYKGVAEALQARYVWSPLAKLRAVRVAQVLFTQAVGTAPANVEVRFLRFTIETNVPRYLGFSQHLADDRAFIIRGAAHPAALGLDPGSLRAIRGFMLKYGDCTSEEARMLSALNP